MNMHGRGGYFFFILNCSVAYCSANACITCSRAKGACRDLEKYLHRNTIKLTKDSKPTYSKGVT